MLRKNHNIVHKIFSRQVRTSLPGTQIHMVREFYENLVPGCTIYDVECPDYSFKKFTNDGQYLICFSRSHQDLIVYRHRWPTSSWKGEYCEHSELPPKARNFESYFSHLYTLNLASGNEFICKDLFLSTENNQFGIVATQMAPDQDTSVSESAIQGIPSIEKITLFLFRLSNGEIMDTRVFPNDYIHLNHNLGVFLYDDLLSILSIRYQTIHILQIRDGGTFVDVRTIGKYCREDDELVLNSHSQRAGTLSDITTQHNHQMQHGNFFGGMKQRLLSFNYRSICNDNSDPAQRLRKLKRFYYNFQHYADLIMWKVQFLDRHHLLVKYGSVDGVLSRTPDLQTSFLAVYNIETTEMLAFFKNSSEELLGLFEQYCDHFRALAQYPMYMRFISSCSNNGLAREQLRKQKTACMRNKLGACSQLAKKTLMCLPFNCQSQSPSPYFDLSLFNFDEKVKLISSTDRHRQCMEHPIKFTSRRPPHCSKFRINPGLEIGSNDGRTKRVVSFIFHPVLPFAISVQQAFMQPSIVNIHIRR